MFLITKFKSTCFYSFIISFLIFMLEGISVSIVYMLTNNQGVSYFIGYLIAIIIVVFKKRKELINDAKSFKQDIKGKVKSLILTYVLLTIIMYITNAILFYTFGTLASNESDIRATLYASPILVSLSLSLLAPIIEELGFRYPYKNAKTNKHIKYIIYSSVFAFLHIITDLSFPGILYIIPYLFLSLGIGHSFYKTNNIYTSMIAHIFNNTSTVLLLLIF